MSGEGGDRTGSVAHLSTIRAQGGDYEVLLVARDTEAEQPVVMYQALYGEHGFWTRSLANFTAHITDRTTTADVRRKRATDRSSRPGTDARPGSACRARR